LGISGDSFVIIRLRDAESFIRILIAWGRDDRAIGLSGIVRCCRRRGNHWRLWWLRLDFIRTQLAEFFDVGFEAREGVSEPSTYSRKAISWAVLM
jgi:hypothetical protein